MSGGWSSLSLNPTHPQKHIPAPMKLALFLGLTVARAGAVVVERQARTPARFHAHNAARVAMHRAHVLESLQQASPATLKSAGIEVSARADPDPVIPNWNLYDFEVRARGGGDGRALAAPLCSGAAASKWGCGWALAAPTASSAPPPAVPRPHLSGHAPPNLSGAPRRLCGASAQQSTRGYLGGRAGGSPFPCPPFLSSSTPPPFTGRVRHWEQQSMGSG